MWLTQKFLDRRRAAPYTGFQMPLRSLIASLLVVTLSGAPVSIGLISANGPLTVNHAAAWGNATLFEGTSVATAEASGDLALRNGVRIQLAAQSQAKIGEAQEVLEKGSSQVNAKQAYEVQARGLKIAAPAGSRVMIALKQANSVEVTAVAGGARVSDHAGLLLASINPAAAWPSPFRRSACERGPWCNSRAAGGLPVV